MIATKCLKALFERMWYEKKKCDMKKKKSYLDDGPGPSKDIIHLNACIIRKLRVAIMKENFFKKMIEIFLRWWELLVKIIVEERAENKQKKIMGYEV